MNTKWVRRSGGGTCYAMSPCFHVYAVPMSEKVDADCEARDLAEEGLYVGRKPLVLARERYKMENRLLREADGQVTISTQ